METYANGIQVGCVYYFYDAFYPNEIAEIIKWEWDGTFDPVSAWEWEDGEPRCVDQLLVRIAEAIRAELVKVNGGHVPRGIEKIAG